MSKNGAFDKQSILTADSNKITTSANEVMFYPAFVCLSVCVSVCLSVSNFT